jgi:hypothetical protein
MTIKRAENPYDLCQFQYADGRCCGLPTIPSGDGLCRSHASLKRFHPAPEEEAAPSFTDFASDPPSEEDVHRAVGRIMQALAANRISTRRAATFGYLAQLLLTSTHDKASPTTQTIYKLWSEAVAKTYGGSKPAPTAASSSAAPRPATSPAPKSS